MTFLFGCTQLQCWHFPESVFVWSCVKYLLSSCSNQSVVRCPSLQTKLNKVSVVYLHTFHWSPISQQETHFEGMPRAKSKSCALVCAIISASTGQSDDDTNLEAGKCNFTKWLVYFLYLSSCVCTLQSPSSSRDWMLLVLWPSHCQSVGSACSVLDVVHPKFPSKKASWTWWLVAVDLAFWHKSTSAL